jgi:hypothetical protein
MQRYFRRPRLPWNPDGALMLQKLAAAILLHSGCGNPSN